MPELIKEFEYFLDFDEFYEVGLGPFGERRIFNVAGGQFAGDRLKGTIVGGSDPSLLFGQDGFARIDTHETYETDDGAVIYVQYFGLLELTPGILDILRGGTTPTNFGEQYFFTNPRLETGDERYSWVNQTLFIGEGRLIPGRAEYRVHRVANC